MLLHRCQDTEVSLYAASVVVVDIMLNHLDQRLLTDKAVCHNNIPASGYPQKPSIGPLSMQCAIRDILCIIPA